MDVTSALAVFQERAESRMRDTCQIQTFVTGSSMDPVTWLPTETPTTVYTGKCRLRMPAGWAQQRDVAGDHASISMPTLSIPVSAPVIPIGAVVRITAVPSDDPAGHLRMGRRFRVLGQMVSTDSTAQRMTIEAVTG